jgi:transposase-like protein
MMNWTSKGRKGSRGISITNAIEGLNDVNRTKASSVDHRNKRKGWPKTVGNATIESNQGSGRVENGTKTRLKFS